ncbi:hypothetical protein Taro_033290, partial [Colocasia esculenta]|nr:hypothetical protein [Colocasia esculenta]
LAASSGSRQGNCRDVVPITSSSGSIWVCDRRYVAFLKTTYPLSPSGLMDGDMGYVTFLKATWPMSPSHRIAADARNCDRGYVTFLKATHPLSPSSSQGDTSARRRRPNLREGPNGCVLRVEVGTSDSFALSMIPSPSRPCMVSMLPSLVCSVSPVSGRFPEEESSEPPTGLKATYPVSPSDCSLVRSHTSRSLGARHLRACPVREVVTVTWDPVLGSLLREYSGLRVCSKLSWLVWDAEDSLEFYPAQASQGYVAFLKMTYPLSPSGLMDGDMEYVAFLKVTWPMSPSHRVAPDAWNCDTGTVGLKPGRPSPSPSLAPLLSSSLSLALSKLPAVLGCLPHVEAAVLWRVTLRSYRGCVRAVRCEEETAKPTRRPQRVRSSRGGDRAYVAFLKATWPMSPSQSRGRLCFRRFRFSLYCTRGTCASSLVRSHTSRSPGARHLRACPVREVVTVTWDPRPREPIEGVLRATSVLELAAVYTDSRAEGKTVVRTVVCESLAELSWLVWDAEDSLEFYPA